jgi:hypothetical protein
MVKRFVYYWNLRQLWRRTHPRYGHGRSPVSFVTFRV